MIITNSGKKQNYSTLNKVWEHNANCPVYSDIECCDLDNDGLEDVIFITNDDTLHVLTIEGNLKWKKKLEPISIIENIFLDRDSIRIKCSSPVIADINDDGKKEIVVGSTNSYVYAFDCDGKKRWEFKTGGEVNSTAAIADINNDGKKEIIIGSDDSKLYALSSDGKVIWNFDTGYPIKSRIIVEDFNNDNNKEIVFGCEDNNVYALDNRGNLLWKYPTEGGVSGAVGIGDLNNDGETKIVAGSNDSYIYVIKNNGNLDWKFKTNGIITSDIVISKILEESGLSILAGVCSSQENLVAVSKENALLGSFDAGFWVASTPVLFHGKNNINKIIFGSFDHQLYVLPYEIRDNDSHGYSKILSKNILMFDSGAVIVGRPGFSEKHGYAVVANKKGNVYCIKIA